MTDFLMKNTNGLVDMIFDDQQFATTDGFETALLVSLGADRRANSSEMPVIQLRRGWFGNLVWNNNGQEMGSKLWLLSQSKLTQDTINNIVSFSEQALIWLVTDKYAQSITVSAEQTDNSSVALTIKIRTNNNLLITSSYEVKFYG